MFFKRKSKNKKSILSLREDILKDLNSCYAGNLITYHAYLSEAQKYLLNLFGHNNKSYSNIILKLSLIQKVDYCELNDWQSKYEKFTKDSLYQFGKECNNNHGIELYGDLEIIFRDIIDSNNSYISKLSSIISKQLTNNHYNPVPGNIFLVHGHGMEIRNYFDQRLKVMGYNPIILDREIKTGTTVLEKFMSYANKSSKAIIFMTADDKVVKEKNEYCQARPNVFIELGYFLGIMDKRDIIIVKQDGATIPSDIGGVVYEPYSNNNEKALFERIIKALNIN